MLKTKEDCLTKQKKFDIQTHKENCENNKSNQGILMFNNIAIELFNVLIKSKRTKILTNASNIYNIDIS